MINYAERIMFSNKGKTSLFSLGQAGFIIRSSSGQLLAIDLYLSNCVERVEGNMGYKRLLPQLLLPSEIVFDVIICTHPHFDHFDVDAVPEMISNKKSKLFCSVNCRELIEKLKLQYYEKKIIYVKPQDSYECGDFRMDFVSCDHGESAKDAVGVIITVDKKRIFETGDTCIRLDRVNEYLRFGDIDIMIAPINGAYGNMNEEDCARFSNAIKPKVIIPCHYGMFASHGGNPGKFCEIMRTKYENVNYMLMRQGESIEL